MFLLENISSLLIGIFVLILIVMAILIPFFVFQIRDYTLRIKKEIIQLNKHMLLLNDNIIGLRQFSPRDNQPNQGLPMSECSWCHKIFPSSQAKIFKHVTLCPDCAKKQP